MTVIVADADAHHAHAKLAGAVIVDELEAKDYSGNGHSFRDPEGHLGGSAPMIREIPSGVVPVADGVD